MKLCIFGMYDPGGRFNSAIENGISGTAIGVTAMKPGICVAGTTAHHAMTNT